MKQKAPRMLILEDDPDLLSALERQFAQEAPEIEVRGVRGGIVAFEVANDFQPDVILLDLLVPQMRGLDFLRRIRNLDWAASVKVVVLTNFDKPEFLEEAQSLGVSDFLVKANHTLPEIVGRVKNLLRERVAIG